MEKWLLLTDYASKYRISVSTLRRRIKAGAQAHRFEAGRYYLPDEFDPTMESVNANGTVAKPSSKLNSVNLVSTAQPIAVQAAPLNQSSTVTPAASSSFASTTAPVNDEPLITTTSKLLNELKQAYTLILHEKEEQIIYLKEEIADLKTLVRVLESDNARLRKTPAGHA